LGFNLHYFLLSNRQIIIRNAFLFWKKHNYPIDDILEIVFESHKKMSDSILIITKVIKPGLIQQADLTTGIGKI
jgi:hypothetical protein